MHRLGRIAALVVSILVVTACAGSAATPVGPLVTVQLRGGECFAPPCGMTVILDRDGRVHGAAKPPNDLGTVPSDRLLDLVTLVATTDYASIRSHPFTGQCPTAYDGQEIVYEFGAPSGIERIATCEVDVDFGQPLLVAVSAALGPFIPLPTT